MNKALTVAALVSAFCLLAATWVPQAPRHESGAAVSKQIDKRLHAVLGKMAKDARGQRGSSSK